MYGQDDNGSEGPKGTFEIYRAEADSLYKQGEYRKAIESYTIVSSLSPPTIILQRQRFFLKSAKKWSNRPHLALFPGIRIMFVRIV